MDPIYPVVFVTAVVGTILSLRKERRRHEKEDQSEQVLPLIRSYRTLVTHDLQDHYELHKSMGVVSQKHLREMASNIEIMNQVHDAFESYVRVRGVDWIDCRPGERPDLKACEAYEQAVRLLGGRSARSWPRIDALSKTGSTHRGVPARQSSSS